MNMEQLEARLKTLEDRISNLDDVEEIKKLQRIYAFYLERGMFEEIIDLFSDNAESIDSSGGVYLNIDGRTAVIVTFQGRAGRQSQNQIISARNSMESPGFESGGSIPIWPLSEILVFMKMLKELLRQRRSLLCCFGGVLWSCTTLSRLG